MKTIMVSHGRVTHPFETRHDCMACLEMKIEFLQALRKAGGQTKFLAKLKKGKV